MKLQNKRTGEIKDWSFSEWLNHIISSGGQGCNLKEFIERVEKFEDEWEDYEETKDFQYIMEDGNIDLQEDDNSIFSNNLKQIGNYFETFEEAEKAVEKLKAWKRLKDKGFKIKYYEASGGVKGDKIQGEFEIYAECGDFIPEKDLDLLFGGEE